MKQVYSFYYTGEEHRSIENKREKYMILSFFFLFCFYCLGVIAILLYVLDSNNSRPYMFFICIPTAAFSGLGLYPENKSPTRKLWYGKQEYTIEGNKATIHITTGRGISSSKDFMIQKRVEKPEGIYLYKNRNYYIVIPHRVQPTIINN